MFHLSTIYNSVQTSKKATHFHYKDKFVNVIKEIIVIYTEKRRRGSSVHTVSDYGLGDGVIVARSSAKDFFPLASASKPALRPTQPPVQWVPRVLSPRV
jgi:hypothetical protein